MDIKNKIQNQCYIISRFDNLYSAVNNKGSFLIAFHTFLIGAIIWGYGKIGDNASIHLWSFAITINRVLSLLAAISILSVFLLLMENSLILTT